VITDPAILADTSIVGDRRAGLPHPAAGHPILAVGLAPQQPGASFRRSPVHLLHATNMQETPWTTLLRRNRKGAP
jgi:hypothetical protein